MTTRITFSSTLDTHNFLVGDITSSGIVTRVDHDRCQIICEEATWWRRAYYRARDRVLHAWWFIRCRAYDVAEWVTGLFRRPS